MKRRRAAANVVAMDSQLPPHVVIAGGGVAALEALMALRAHAGAEDLQITLLAPDRDFRYRPMAVAEPFSIARAHRLALADLAAEFDAELVTGALAAVDAEARCAVTPAVRSPRSPPRDRPQLSSPMKTGSPEASRPR